MFVTCGDDLKVLLPSSFDSSTQQGHFEDDSHHYWTILSVPFLPGIHRGLLRTSQSSISIFWSTPGTAATWLHQALLRLRLTLSQAHRKHAPRLNFIAYQNNLLTIYSRIVTAIRTGLVYDVEDMSPISQENAAEGLHNDRMSMIRCYERDADFHFELQERIRVTFSDEGAPTCSTCPDQDGRACRHIWWVNDQILSTVVNEQARSQFQYEVSRSGHAYRRADEQTPLMFHEILEDRGLEDLARRGGWWKQDPTDQQDTRLVEDTASHILSTFEPSGVLSTQHGQENFEMLQQESQ
jgi:hypothetical protein